MKLLQTTTLILTALFALSATAVALEAKSASLSEQNIAQGETPMSLSARQYHLARVSALTAKAETNELKTAVNQALDNGLTVNEIKDAMVQLYAYLGFPRSLNALNVLAETVKDRQEKGIATETGREPAARPADMTAQGSRTQTELVGQKVDLTALSPDIDRYLKTHLFGDIFASDLLTWQEREIVTVAALNQLESVESQLNAHEDISRKNGITDEQLNAIKQISPPPLSRFPVGEPNDAYARYFSGKSYLAPISTEQVKMYNVTFEPSVRNNWHIHHADKGGGQILIVTAGKGYYQEWGKPAQALKPGDVVNIPANVKHWHGAAANSWFQHIAVEVEGENTRNEWLEAVSDEEYGKLK